MAFLLKFMLHILELFSVDLLSCCLPRHICVQCDLGLSVFLLSLRPKKSGERALGNDSPATEPFEQIPVYYGEKIEILVYQDVLCFHIHMIKMERSGALRTCE